MPDCSPAAPRTAAPGSLSAGTAVLLPSAAAYPQTGWERMWDKVGTATGLTCCPWPPPSPTMLLREGGWLGAQRGCWAGDGGRPPAVLGGRVLHPRVGWKG